MGWTGWSREQLRAGAVLLGLALLALVPWWVASFSVEEEVRRASTVGHAALAPARGLSPSAGDAEVRAADPGPPAEERSDHERDRSSAAAQEPVEVDLDGGCTVEVPGRIEDRELRAWDFPSCEHAPIGVDEGEVRWVVVVASFSGDDFTASEAGGRAAGGGRLVLWSSHYPSLNPDLWVVIDGPYRDEEAAEEAAETLGNGAYARVLSEDPADRFCIAEDGCVGARRS